METTIVYWGYIGIMENEMGTTTVYWGYIGIMENEMETTIVYWGYKGCIGFSVYVGGVGFYFKCRVLGLFLKS